MEVRVQSVTTPAPTDTTISFITDSNLTEKEILYLRSAMSYFSGNDCLSVIVQHLWAAYGHNLFDGDGSLRNAIIAIVAVIPRARNVADCCEFLSRVHAKLLATSLSGTMGEKDLFALLFARFASRQSWDDEISRSSICRTYDEEFTFVLRYLVERQRNVSRSSSLSYLWRYALSLMMRTSPYIRPGLPSAGGRRSVRLAYEMHRIAEAIPAQCDSKDERVMGFCMWKEGRLREVPWMQVIWELCEILKGLQGVFEMVLFAQEDGRVVDTERVSEDLRVLDFRLEDLNLRSDLSNMVCIEVRSERDSLRILTS